MNDKLNLKLSKYTLILSSFLALVILPWGLLELMFKGNLVIERFLSDRIKTNDYTYIESIEFIPSSDKISLSESIALTMLEHKYRITIDKNEYFLIVGKARSPTGHIWYSKQTNLASPVESKEMLRIIKSWKTSIPAVLIMLYLILLLTFYFGREKLLIILKQDLGKFRERKMLPRGKS